MATDDLPTDDLNNTGDTIPDTPKGGRRFKGPTKEEIEDAIENVETTNLDRVKE